MASSGPLRRPRLFHSLGSFMVEFLHASVEVLRHLPFPFGIVVRMVNLCLYPAVATFEKLSLLLLALADLQVWLVLDQIENILPFSSPVLVKLRLLSGTSEHVLTAISSNLKRQGFIGSAADLLDKYVLAVTDGTQKAATTVTEIAFFGEANPDTCDIAKHQVAITDGAKGVTSLCESPSLSEDDPDTCDIVKYQLLVTGGAQKGVTTPHEIPSLSKDDHAVCANANYQLVDTDDAQGTVPSVSEIPSLTQAKPECWAIAGRLATDRLVEQNEHDIVKYQSIVTGGAQKGVTTPREIPSLSRDDLNVCASANYQLVDTDGAQRTVPSVSEIPSLTQAKPDCWAIAGPLATDRPVEHNEHDIDKYQLVVTGGAQKGVTTPREIPSLSKDDLNVCASANYQLVDTDGAQATVPSASEIPSLTQAKPDCWVIAGPLASDQLVEHNEHPVSDDSLSSAFHMGDDKSAKEIETTAELTREKEEDTELVKGHVKIAEIEKGMGQSHEAKEETGIDALLEMIDDRWYVGPSILFSKTTKHQ